MASGETILKFTDYPFAYSIIGIISGILGFEIAANQIIFLGMAGAFGTFLAITDPIGWLLRKNEEDRINKGYDIKYNSKLTLEKQYKIRALRTKSISFELEKIIGLFYFIIILILFLAATMPPESLLFEKLIIKNSVGEPLCDILCFKISYLFVVLVPLIILIIKANRFWKDLDNKIMVAGYHQIAINDDNATQQSIENMTRAVEQNDWELAKIWQVKIKEEIKYKKGKRELIIKAADTVFSPLHLESFEFQKHLDIINMTKQYTNFETKQWNSIKQQSIQSIIEDKELRHRIENFYNLMKDYNDASREVSREMGVIINKKFSKNFNKNVEDVEFYLDSPNSGNSVNLHNCAMFEIHPLEIELPPREFGSFKLRIKTGRTVNYSEYLQLTDFDKTWKQVLDDVKMNKILLKTKKCLEDLETENKKLMQIYSDKIEMQWNV